MTSVYGVDFSGARVAGRTTWVAYAVPTGRAKVRRLKLLSLAPLERLVGTAERAPALGGLVEMILASDGALWGIDAPFGLPVEILDPGASWRDLIAFVQRWEYDARAFGYACLDRSVAYNGSLHIRRETDAAEKAPFDCYHYRIVYQTYHAMRDVVPRLARAPRTAVLPFQYAKVRTARRVVTETCPSSTLKRWGAPHHTYKQPAGGTLTRERRATRRRILAALRQHVEIGERHCRAIARDGGGDALDAVIAAAGVWQAWHRTDHDAVRKNVRAVREGYPYT